MIVLAAIVCKSVKEQKIAEGPHVPAMYMNDSHKNQWLTNIMSAYYITPEFVFTLQTNSEKPLIRTEGHNTVRLYHTSLHLLPGRVWKHSYSAPDILYGLSEKILVSKLILKKLADCMKKKKKKKKTRSTQSYSQTWKIFFQGLVPKDGTASDEKKGWWGSKVEEGSIFVEA